MGAAGLYTGDKLGTPYLRLHLVNFLAESAGPPSNIDAPPAAWFEILIDNTVNSYLPKSEMGQGVHTGLAQIAAEELEVELGQMQGYHAPTTRLADPVGNSASNSIQYPLLRNSNPPDTEVVVLNSLQTPSGMGEPPIGPIPAAVVHAVFTAAKSRLRHPPLKFI